MELEVGKYYISSTNPDIYCVINAIKNNKVFYTRFIKGNSKIFNEFTRKEFSVFYSRPCQKRNNALYKLLNE